MNLTLREEDRRAVDLLLDGAATAEAAQNGGAVSFAVTDASLGERVARTYKLVHLLEALPSLDPPADLLERTLKFVENAPVRPSATEGDISGLLSAQRPIV
ncbi:MAG TPA: hypothetical protein VIM11_16940 [Tepidisphaeraceae bacterium]|jgi:hypothetical protein